MKKALLEETPVQTKETLNTEARYKQLLADKVEEIRRICVQEQIPCFLAFGLREAGQEDDRYKIESVVENKDKTIDTLKTTTIIPEILPINFTDRRFSDFINVLNDFHTIPPSEYAKMVPDDIQMVDLPSTESRSTLEKLAEEYQKENSEEK